MKPLMWSRSRERRLNNEIQKLVKVTDEGLLTSAVCYVDSRTSLCSSSLLHGNLQ